VADKIRSKIMKPNITSDRASTGVLHDDELNIVTGGIAASHAWVSPMEIHGFNPQPDPPGIWNARALPGATGHA
jgi:hypothetical protein